MIASDGRCQKIPRSYGAAGVTQKYSGVSRAFPASGRMPAAGHAGAEFRVFQLHSDCYCRTLLCPSRQLRRCYRCDSTSRTGVITRNTEMRMFIYIAFVLVGLLMTLVGLLGLAGSMLPATHQTSVSVEVSMPREKVWALLDDVAAFPSWLPGIDKVELLPDREGRRVFKQFQGRNAFVLEETVKVAPSRVARTISDENKMFSGSWDHGFEDIGQGRTRVTVSVTGTIPSPIPRSIMRWGTGYDYDLKQFAAALRARCDSGAK